MTSPGMGIPGLPSSGASDTQNIANQLGAFFSGLDGVVAVVQGIVSGLQTAINTIFGRVNGHDTELAGLQSTTQDLLGVIGYGNAYSTSSFSLSLGSVKYGMTNTIGKPDIGVVWTAGSVYLGSKGLWEADGRVTLGTYAPPIGRDISLTLKVFAPDGSPYYETAAVYSTGEEFTHSLHMPFTVPSAGYYVEMWVNAAIGRGIYGGSKWNGLSVNKISMETS